jgi:hypothetical protein
VNNQGAVLVGLLQLILDLKALLVGIAEKESP